MAPGRRLDAPTAFNNSGSLGSDQLLSLIEVSGSPTVGARGGIGQHRLAFWPVATVQDAESLPSHILLNGKIQKGVGRFRRAKWMPAWTPELQGIGKRKGARSVSMIEEKIVHCLQVHEGTLRDDRPKRTCRNRIVAWCLLNKREGSEEMTKSDTVCDRPFQAAITRWPPSGKLP
jgi:hypothetical protein